MDPGDDKPKIADFPIHFGCGCFYTFVFLGFALFAGGIGGGAKTVAAILIFGPLLGGWFAWKMGDRFWKLAAELLSLIARR